MNHLTATCCAIVAVSALVLTACGERASKAAYPSVSSEEFAREAKEGQTTLLDISGTSAYREHHIANAIDYQAHSADLPTVLPSDRAKPIVVYGADFDSGHWQSVMDQLAAQGYTNVKHYNEGMRGYTDHHGAVVAADGAAVDASSIGKDELTKMIADGGDKSPFLLDISGSSDYRSGHLPGAVDYAAHKSELARVLPEHKERPVVIYGQGFDSGDWRKVAGEVQALGYSNIRHYNEGFSNWKSSGGPVVLESNETAVH
jgi:rhodanese-related sulfurtransferase